MSIVKINALTVPTELRETLEQRFASRAGMVENSDGFEWFELLRPLDGADQYLVYTRWRSEEDFDKWMRSSMENAHRAGRQPAASDSQAWTFEVIQQAAPKTD
jgi:heme-degrading monooxygenase HmoA